MNLALCAFLLSLAVYLLGILAAKTLIPHVGALATWLKEMRSKNYSAGAQMMMAPYHKIAIWIGMGNLAFGLLLVVSGTLLGLPPLILLFRSTLMAWGILDSSVFDMLKQKRNYFRYLVSSLAVVEALLFILWSSLGVGIGLSIIALLISRSDLVARQMPLLAVLPWVVIVIVLAHVICALVEAHVAATFKPAFIQSFSQHPAETAEGQESTLAEKELVVLVRLCWCVLQREIPNDTLRSNRALSTPHHCTSDTLRLFCCR
jgi:hypothetical protein